MLEKPFLILALLLIGEEVCAQELQQLGDENPTSKQWQYIINDIQ